MNSATFETTDVREQPTALELAPEFPHDGASPVPLNAAPASYGHLWLVLGLTLLGGFVRFATIERPPIWGDEGYTYSRIIGSFRELLDILQFDGFAPLHYELYWVIKQLPLSAASVYLFLPALAALLLLPLAYLGDAQWVPDRPSRGARLGIAAIPAIVAFFLLRWSLHPGTHGEIGSAGHAITRFAPLWAALLLAPAVFCVARVLWNTAAAIVAAVLVSFSLGFVVYALLDVTAMTPPVLRFVPALSGTLMIPAMYFLAVQIVSRRAALLSALFTTVSAYMMCYSHDAKMYPHEWLMVTLSIGCLLWWMRTESRVAYLAWIACSVAGAGLDEKAFYTVLVVGPLIFLAKPRSLWRIGLYVACIVSMLLAWQGVFSPFWNRCAFYLPIIIGAVAVALPTPFWVKRLLAAASSGPLSPVLRGEGGGEGLDDKLRGSPTSSFDPSPQPSPLSTGERGPEAAATIERYTFSRWRIALYFVGAVTVILARTAGFKSPYNHAAFYIPVGIVAVIALIHQYTLRRFVPFILGLAIVVVGWAGYFRTGFNHWQGNSEDRGVGGGVPWVENYNSGRNGTDLVLFTASAHLYNWEWPGGQNFGTIPPSRLHALEASGVIVFLIAAAGILPWMPWRKRAVPGSGTLLGGAADDAPAPEPGWRRSLWLIAWIVLPCYVAYCISMPHFSAPGTWLVAAGDLFHQHWILLAIEAVLLAAICQFWDAAPRFIAAAVLVAAVAVFNVLLVRDGWHFDLTWAALFSGKGAALKEMGHWQWIFWTALCAQAAIVAAFALVRRRGVRFFAMIVAAVIFFAIDECWLNAGLDALATAGWSAATGWMDIASDSRVMGALIAIVPPLLWYFSGRTFAQRVARTLQGLLIAAVVLGSCTAVYFGYQHKWRKEAARILEHHDDVPYFAGTAQQAQTTHGVPTEGEALERTMSERPRATPVAAKAQADAMIADAKERWESFVTQAMASHDVPTPAEAERRVAADNDSYPEPAELHRRAGALRAAAQEKWDRYLTQARVRRVKPTDQEAERLAAEHLAAEHVAAEELSWKLMWRSAWMPRYLGGMWPALAIALSCLLLRLPTRGLRWGAIGFVLLLNVVQSSARLYAGNEPPTQIIAADVLAAQTETLDGQPTHSVTRTYIQQGIDTAIGAHPGSMMLFGNPMKYHLAVGRGKPVLPREFRGMDRNPALFKQVFGVEIVVVGGGRFGDAGNDLRAHPDAARVIYWDRLPAPLPDAPPAPPEPDRSPLGPQWKLASDERFIGRMHWLWGDLYVLRRREYLKLGEKIPQKPGEASSVPGS